MPPLDDFGIQLLLMKLFFLGVILLNILALLKPTQMLSLNYWCTKKFRPGKKQAEDFSSQAVDRFKKINIGCLVLFIIILIILQVLFKA